MEHKAPVFNESDLFEMGLMAAADPEFIARALLQLVAPPAGEASPAASVPTVQRVLACA